jgi:hypothetical protein
MFDRHVVRVYRKATSGWVFESALTPGGMRSIYEEQVSSPLSCTENPGLETEIQVEEEDDCQDKRGLNDVPPKMLIDPTW